VGSATPMAYKGRGRVGTVSNHVSEAVAAVTLGECGTRGEFLGIDICAEDGRRFSADELGARAVWVVE
jgi:hypothetical protein